MRLFALSSSGVALASMMVWVACSSSSTPSAGTATDSGANDTGTGLTGDSGATGAIFALGVPCTDSIASVYGDPGTLPADPGDIIKCAPDTDISMSALLASQQADLSADDAPAANIGYTGKPFTSGAHVYRILYRTQRGDTAGSPGYSSAKVFIPDTPRTSGKLPLLVGARGSRGQAGICTASQENDAGVWVNGDYEALAFPMVGFGFPIIVPDLAGYSNFGAAGNPMSGYAQVEDVARSTLDGARALAKMFPNASNGKTVIIGHSQGGHSAFASLALQAAYAPELKIAGVAVYSPLWISQASWGALLDEGYAYPLRSDISPTAVSVWYHYTHGELLDGPGHGLDPFVDASVVQNAILQFVNNDCWDTGYDGGGAAATGGIYPPLQAVAMLPTDLFSSSFAASVAISAAQAAVGSTANCPTTDDGGIDPVCAKWIARYAHDRPHLSNTPPILIEYGLQDQTLAPGLMSCVVDRLKVQDKVPFSFCLDPLYGHTGIVRAHSADVAAWIGAQTLGEAQPAACTFNEANLTLDGGTGGDPILCEVPPPNE